MTGPNNPYPKGALGVIEPGAYADILLVNGDPLRSGSSCLMICYVPILSTSISIQETSDHLLVFCVMLFCFPFKKVDTRLTQRNCDLH